MTNRTRFALLMIFPLASALLTYALLSIGRADIDRSNDPRPALVRDNHGILRSVMILRQGNTESLWIDGAWAAYYRVSGTRDRPRWEQLPIPQMGYGNPQPERVREP